MKTVNFDGNSTSMAADTFEVDGRKVKCLSGHVICSQILGLSNEPNVRDVNPKAPVIPKIVHTLLTEPEMMPMKCGGLTITADSFQFKNGKWVLNMGEKDGIINGGHCQYGVYEGGRRGAKLETVKIPIRILESKELTDDDIASISTSLNESSSPSVSTLAEKKGLTNIMKKSLKPCYAEKIEWKENTMSSVPHLSLDDFVMLLNLLDIRSYNSFDNPEGKKNSKNIKNVIARWNDEKLSFDYLSPIMNDIIELYDTINGSLTRMINLRGKKAIKNIEVFITGQKRQKSNQAKYFGADTQSVKKTLFLNETYEYSVNKAFMYVIMAAFRANLSEDEGGLRWIIPDVCQFCREIEPALWATLVDNTRQYVEIGRNGEKSVDASASTKTKSAVWGALFNVVSAEVYKRMAGYSK